MSQSWGHAVRWMTEQEIAAEERRHEEAVAKWGESAGRYHRCSAPKCSAPKTHRTRYSYVTGRAGRISYAQREVCPLHARRFAEKYGIEIEDVQERQPHITEVAIRSFFGSGPLTQGQTP